MIRRARETAKLALPRRHSWVTVLTGGPHGPRRHDARAWLQAVERGAFVDRPLPEPSLRSVLGRLVQPAPAGPPILLETGIKVIDLLMPREKALEACAAILDGAHDAVPEAAFYFTGGIGEVLARA